MDDLAILKDTLLQASPAKRLKFLRQKVIQKNQSEFCLDGIIRSGTLKSVETEKLKISPRIAERLVHKFRLEGIICTNDLFLEESSDCEIEFDRTRANIIGPSAANMEEIRKKLTTLTPIHIDKNLCPSLIPKGATALARELKVEDIQTLKNTLCLVHGTKSFVSFLSYDDKQIISVIDGKTEYFSDNIINFCGLYAIEILYFNV